MGRQQATLLGVVACLSIAGCSSWVYQRAADHREANPYEGDIPVGSGQSGRKFFDRRLRDIVIGVQVLSIETDASGITEVEIAETAEHMEYTIRVLTPISTKGYALTSLHPDKWELPEGKEHHATVLPREPGAREVGGVRWLWCSRDLDLALVDVTGIPVHPFPWAEGPQLGAAVYLGGTKLAPSEGALLAIEESVAGGMPYARIIHSAPARSGDSGGALVDAEGRLLGINTKISPGVFRANDSRTIAIRPDRATLEQIIARYEADTESAYDTYLEACSAE